MNIGGCVELVEQVLTRLRQDDPEAIAPKLATSPATEGQYVDRAESHTALVGPLGARQQAQQRRLSRARRPGNDRHPANGDVEVDPIEGGDDVAGNGESAYDSTDCCCTWLRPFHASPPSFVCA